MSEDQIIEGLRAATREYNEVDKLRREAGVIRRERIREARSAGLGVDQIAHATGLSRQAVYELLEHRPPS